MRTQLPHEHEEEAWTPLVAYLGSEQGRSVVAEEEGNDIPSPISVSSVPIYISGRHPSPEGTQKPVLVPSYTEVHSPLEVGSCIHLAQNQPWKEDRLFLTQGHLVISSQTLPYALFLVVDGTGGHHLTGHDACEMVIEAVVGHILPKVTQAESCRDEWNEQALRTMVMESVQAANTALFQCNQENHAYMEVSMAACLVVDTTACIANIGRTRAYLYCESIGLQRMAHEGIHDAETHYLGEHVHVHVNPCVLSLQSSKRMLLCTDGLWKTVEEVTLEKSMSNLMANAQQISYMLLQTAKELSMEDHMSAIVVCLT